MNFIKKTFLALTVLVALNACSNDDDAASKTNAKITVTSANGPVSDMVVYVYDETTWEVIGEDPLFAQGQAATNSEGVATFSNLEYPTAFIDVNNNQNTMRFSAHYTINGVDKVKFIPITFTKGDSKTGTLVLN